jgi:hypothetical protein
VTRGGDLHAPGTASRRCRSMAGLSGVQGREQPTNLAPSLLTQPGGYEPSLAGRGFVALGYLAPVQSYG